jgi:hypothetical protein
MAIELSLTPDTRRADPAAELIAAASGAGFAALGLAEQDADADCAALLAGAGLRCHELLALAVTAGEEATLRHARRLAAAAAAPYGRHGCSPHSWRHWAGPPRR